MTFLRIFDTLISSLRGRRTKQPRDYFAALVMTVFFMVNSTSVIAQEADSTAFNDQKEHGISLGFSITSFNANLTYQISPAYYYRMGRHQIMFNPFVGRLEEINGQFDFGFGLNYRLYPAKNLRIIRMFIQAGADYVFQQNSTRKLQSILYRLGPGVEVSPVDKLTVGINIDLGLLQRVSSNVYQSSEVSIPEGDAGLRVKILPFVRIAYIIG
jgi:hypothetical protein